MKNILLTILVLTIFSINIYSQKVIRTIEFDGVYIEVAPQRYVQLEEVSAYSGKYVRGGQTYTSYNRLPKLKFTDKNKVVTVNKVRKIILKGANFTANNANLVSVHKAESISPSEVNCNDRSVNWDASKFWVYKRMSNDFYKYNTCKTRMKKIADYHYEITFAEAIQANQEYIVWLNNKFWVFKNKTNSGFKKTKKISSKITSSGVYLRKKNKTYIFLDTTVYKHGKYFEYSSGRGGAYYNSKGRNINPYSPQNNSRYFYISKLQENRNFINASQFNGFIIKGAYDINKAKLYKLEKTLLGNKNILLEKGADTYYSIIKEGVIYRISSANEIEYQRATLSGRFLLKPKVNLTKGYYSFVIGDECWLFEVK